MIIVVLFSPDRSMILSKRRMLSRAWVTVFWLSHAVVFWVFFYRKAALHVFNHSGVREEVEMAWSTGGPFTFILTSPVWPYRSVPQPCEWLGLSLVWQGWNHETQLEEETAVPASCTALCLSGRTELAFLWVSRVTLSPREHWSWALKVSPLS